MSIRAVVEKLSRGCVLRRRMPARFGGSRIFVSPDAALSYWRLDLSKVSKGLFEFAEEFVKPGDTVWDVGACVGLFSFAAAGMAGASGHVVAVEPDTFSVSLLRRSALALPDGMAKVHILPVAVGSSLQVVSFEIASRGRSANFVSSATGSASTGGVRETQEGMAVTMDWLLTQVPAPDIVKIDVEGRELDALKSASTLLAKVRPIVLCEVFRRNARAVTDLFHENGYRLYDFKDHNGGEVFRATYNTLALPTDRQRNDCPTE